MANNVKNAHYNPAQKKRRDARLCVSTSITIIIFSPQFRQPAGRLAKSQSTH